MDAVVKEKWVAALRSGEYIQGRRYLRNNNDEYCCLGVLCDLHSKETNVAQWTKSKFAINEYLGSTALLPMEVHHWSGIEEFGFVHKLMCMNDGEQNSFAEIADYIERSSGKQEDNDVSL